MVFYRPSVCRRGAILVILVLALLSHVRYSDSTLQEHSPSLVSVDLSGSQPTGQSSVGTTENQLITDGECLPSPENCGAIQNLNEEAPLSSTVNYLPNVDYMLKGYNDIMGDPWSVNGVDPGWRVTSPFGRASVISHTSGTKLFWTSSENYAIPVGYDHSFSGSSCGKEKSISVANDITSLATFAKMDNSVSVSAGIPFIFSASFAASGGYQKQAKDLTDTTTSKISNTRFCTAFTVSMQRTNENVYGDDMVVSAEFWDDVVWVTGINGSMDETDIVTMPPPQKDEDFIDCLIDYSPFENRPKKPCWHYFFDKWGTVYPTTAIFGGRMTEVITASKSNVQTLTKDQTSGGASAGLSVYGVGAGGGYKITTDDNQLNDVRKSASSTSMNMLGGAYSSCASNWARTVSKNPIPIKFDTLPIFTLLTPKYTSVYMTLFINYKDESMYAETLEELVELKTRGDALLAQVLMAQQRSMKKHYHLLCSYYVTKGVIKNAAACLPCYAGTAPASGYCSTCQQVADAYTAAKKATYPDCLYWFQCSPEEKRSLQLRGTCIPNTSIVSPSLASIKPVISHPDITSSPLQSLAVVNIVAISKTKNFASCSIIPASSQLTNVEVSVNGTPLPNPGTSGQPWLYPLVVADVKTPLNTTSDLFTVKASLICRYTNSFVDKNNNPIVGTADVEVNWPFSYKNSKISDTTLSVSNLKNMKVQEYENSLPPSFTPVAAGSTTGKFLKTVRLMLDIETKSDLSFNPWVDNAY